MVIKGKTKSGFTFEVERGRLKSWAFNKCLRRIRSRNDEEKFDATMDMIDIILTSEQQDSLLEHLEKRLPEEEKAGGVPASAVLEELNDIIRKASEKEKNSLPSPQ